MKERGYKAIFFDLPNGTEPAKDFLDTLDAKMFAKVIRAINILETSGAMVREP